MTGTALAAGALGAGAFKDTLVGARVGVYEDALVGVLKDSLIGAKVGVFAAALEDCLGGEALFFGAGLAVDTVMGL